MIPLLLQYRYFIIVPLAIFEGPVIMMICGVLLRLGYFDFLPVYLCLMAGDLMGDLMWYGVGYYFGRPFINKFGRFFSITTEGVSTMERLFHRHQNKILIISKLTTGFGFAVATLFTAGLVKIPFKRYALLNFIGEFIWTGFLLGVGYYLGEAYIHINNIIGGFFVVAMIILVFIAIIGFGKYVKSRVIKTHSI